VTGTHPALVSVPSASLIGGHVGPIRVEVHHAAGVLPGFQVVGRSGATCRELRDRVRAAVINSGFSWPTGRVTVNLAPPAQLKVGSGLDLAIALGILATTGWVHPLALEDKAFLGELGLDGALRPEPGALALIEALDQPEVVVPLATVSEARIRGDHVIRAASTLRALVRSLNIPLGPPSSG
jgi:magnesium chelatase family protein